MSPALPLASLRPGQHFDALVIGGSAGAFQALREMLPALRHPELVAIVVLHQSPTGSDLADLFQGIAGLPCITVEDKLPAAPGSLYFAPSGYHLLMEREGTFALSVDAPVNWSRPSIDVSFEATANVFGPRLVGVLLTGASDDGARGLREIADRGGITIVQDPLDAEVSLMPTAAIRLGAPDAQLTVAQMTELFAAWSVTVERRA